MRCSHPCDSRVTMRLEFCVPAHVCNSHTCNDEGRVVCTGTCTVCNSHTCNDHLTCEYFVGQYFRCVSVNDVTYMCMYHGPMQLSLEDDLKEKMATIQELTSAR